MIRIPTLLLLCAFAIFVYCCDNDKPESTNDVFLAQLTDAEIVKPMQKNIPRGMFRGYNICLYLRMG